LTAGSTYLLAGNFPLFCCTAGGTWVARQWEFVSTKSTLCVPGQRSETRDHSKMWANFFFSK